MSYIAADEFGLCIYSNKPIRSFIEGVGYWKNTGNAVPVPNILAKILYENNLLVDCRIPLDKRYMNWGDSPILIKEI